MLFYYYIHVHYQYVLYTSVTIFHNNPTTIVCKWSFDFGKTLMRVEKQIDKTWQQTDQKFLSPKYLPTKTTKPIYSWRTFGWIDANIWTTSCSRANTMCLSATYGSRWNRIYTRWFSFNATQSTCSPLSSFNALGKLLILKRKNGNCNIILITCEVYKHYYYSFNSIFFFVLQYLIYFLI